MTTTLTRGATRTPAPAGSGAWVDEPFDWANDATYVTLPLVSEPASEALQALLRLSADVIARVTSELDRDRHLRRTLAAPVLVAPRVATSPFPDAPSSPAKHPGVQALEQLQDWLGLPLADILSVVRLSPSTRQFWRNNPRAPVRPDKAGRLLRFRTAVGLLVGALGLERARHALHSEGWLKPLDEARLVAFEARVREQLTSGHVTAPDGLAALTEKQLLAAVHPRSGEDAQRLLESSRDGAPDAFTAKDGGG